MFYLFWDTTKHIIPVFICIGSDNTLHVWILLLQTLGKFIACGIIVGAKENILRRDIMTEHRVKNDIRLHAHHGNKPAIRHFLIVHLQIGEHIYCTLKEKSLFARAADNLKAVPIG